jgi:hypothetical protein
MKDMGRVDGLRITEPQQTHEICSSVNLDRSRRPFRRRLTLSDENNVQFICSRVPLWLYVAVAVWPFSLPNLGCGTIRDSI